MIQNLASFIEEESQKAMERYYTLLFILKT
jgi:hypothetical protein